MKLASAQDSMAQPEVHKVNEPNSGVFQLDESAAGAGATRSGHAVEPGSAGDAFAVWGPDIWRLLRFCGVPERMVPDATHDVFVIAHCRWQQFRGESARRSWLMGIALNVARNYRRRAARPAEDPALGPQRQEAAHALPASGEDPFESAARVEVATELQELLDALATPQRQLVILTKLEDVSVVEAATLLSLGEKQARRLLRKACSQMENQLKRRRARDARRFR